MVDSLLWSYNDKIVSNKGKFLREIWKWIPIQHQSRKYVFV